MTAINSADGLRIMDVDALGQGKVVLPSDQLVNLPSNQQLLARDMFSDIPRGLIAGSTSQSMQGFNATVGTVLEPLLASSAASYPIINAPTALTLSSGSALDTAAGTGARTVRVYGVGAGFVSQQEDLVLNGTTAVTSTLTWLGVNRIVVTSAGSLLNNQGAIYAGFGTVTLGVPANILSAIAVNDNKSQGCVFTVPAGFTWEIRSFAVSFSVGGQIQLRSRTNLGLEYRDNTLPIPIGAWVLPSYVGKVVPEKTQIQLWCSCTSTGIVGSVFQAVLRAN